MRTVGLGFDSKGKVMPKCAYCNNTPKMGFELCSRCAEALAARNEEEAKETALEQLFERVRALEEFARSQGYTG